MTLSITIWDVQHGSATYVRMPNGRHWVIDLGTGRVGDREFSPLRRLRERYGVSVLDQITITHPHRDHLDDIWEFESVSPTVLQRPNHLTLADILGEAQPGDDLVIDKYVELSTRYDQPLGPGDDIALSENNGGAEIATFAPTGCARSNLNNHSLVTFIRYAGTTVLIPGDNEAASWRELLEEPSFLDWLETVDVLVAAHHGREAGYCDDLFDFCQPSLVAVSDGPAGDTDAAELYYRHATGWPVRSRTTSIYDTRYVLTTRCDGVIRMKMSWTPEAYLDVSCR